MRSAVHQDSANAPNAGGDTATSGGKPMAEKGEEAARALAGHTARGVQVRWGVVQGWLRVHSHSPTGSHGDPGLGPNSQNVSSAMLLIY